MLHATIMFAASNAKTVQNPSMLTILAFEKVEGNCHIYHFILEMLHQYGPNNMIHIKLTIFHIDNSFI